MFDIEPTQVEKTLAWVVAGRTAKNARDHLNRLTTDEDEDLLKKYLYGGILAEMVCIRDLRDHGFDVEHKDFSGPDNGTDVILSDVVCDIKATSRSTPVTKDYYVTNIHQDDVTRDKPTQAFICCSVNRNLGGLITVCGFIRKVDIREEWLKHRGEKRDRGNSPQMTIANNLYEVKMSELVRSNSWEGICSDLKFYFPKGG